MDRLSIFLFGLFFWIHALPQTDFPPLIGWKQQVSNGINKFTPRSHFNTRVSYEMLPPGDVTTPHLNTAVNHFINLSKTKGKMKRDDMTFSKNKTEEDKTNDQATQKDESKTPLVSPGQGLKPNDVAGVVIHEKYGYGVGGMVTIEYEPYLLLKDGSIFRDPKISPYDLDIKTSRQKQPDKWGTWKVQGKTLVVQMPEKGVMKTNEWKDKKWFWTKPATNGEIINGSFIAMSGGGNTIVGGTTLIAVSSNIRFNSKGQFTHATSAGATSGGANGNAAIYSQADKAGTYKLNGYAIEFYYNNGQIANALFYFFPDGKDTFGMGGRTYTKN